MAYLELYDKDILDLVNIGKTSAEFNEVNGDYIKVEIYRNNSNIILQTLYSNRLLLENSNSEKKLKNIYKVNKSKSRATC